MWTVVCSVSEPLPGNTETISTWPPIAAMSSHGARNCSVESWASRPPASGTLATQARKSRPISTSAVIGTRARSFTRTDTRLDASASSSRARVRGAAITSRARRQWNELSTRRERA